MGWTGPFVPAHSSETSADKRVDLPPIYPPHLHLRVRSVLDFALLGKLVRPEYALYAVSVRRAGSLLRTSFRFHLAMDTLVFRLQFLLTSLYRTLTDKPAHMPRIQIKKLLLTLIEGLQQPFYRFDRCGNQKNLICFLSPLM